MVEIKNTTKQNLEAALEGTNAKFEGNIIFNRFEQKDNRFVVTLTVKSSTKPGARRGQTGRRISAACWHVYGTFFDEVIKFNSDVVITSMGKKISLGYGNWEDKNIGSIARPMMYSDSCDCKEMELF